MDNSEINNFNKSLEKTIDRSTHFIDSYLQCTTFLAQKYHLQSTFLTLSEDAVEGGAEDQARDGRVADPQNRFDQHFSYGGHA